MDVQSTLRDLTQRYQELQESFTALQGLFGKVSQDFAAMKEVQGQAAPPKPKAPKKAKGKQGAANKKPAAAPKVAEAEDKEEGSSTGAKRGKAGDGGRANKKAKTTN